MTARWGVLLCLVFAACASAQTPDPRRTINAANGSAQAQSDSQNQQAVTPTPDTLQAQNATGNPGQVTGDDKDAPKEQLVSVSRLPRLETKRDWIDYATLFGTLALLTLTVWQLWLLRKTVKATEDAAIASKTSADSAAQSLILAYRGFIHIGNWGPPFVLDHQTNILYALSCGGKTDARIEGGFARLQFQMEPITSSEFVVEGDQAEFARNPTAFLTDPSLNWTVPIPPQTVGAWVKTPDGMRPMFTFPAMTPLGVRLWNRGFAITVFLTGEIWYRDAFPKTRRHRKNFAIWYDRKRETWIANSSGWNDEQDDDE